MGDVETRLKMIRIILMVCIPLTLATKEGSGEESGSTNEIHPTIVFNGKASDRVESGSGSSNEDSSTFEKDWVNSGVVTDANNTLTSESIGSTKPTKENGSFRPWRRRWS